MLDFHMDMQCCECGKFNFPGRLFQCVVCVSVNICSDCFESPFLPGILRHENIHPIKCVLTPVAHRLHYGNEKNNNAANNLTYSIRCPYCQTWGFTESTLKEHLLTAHEVNSGDLLTIFTSLNRPAVAQGTEPDGNPYAPRYSAPEAGRFFANMMQRGRARAITGPTPPSNSAAQLRGSLLLNSTFRPPSSELFNVHPPLSISAERMRVINQTLREQLPLIPPSYIPDLYHPPFINRNALNMAPAQFSAPVAPSNASRRNASANNNAVENVNASTPPSASNAPLKEVERKKEKPIKKPKFLLERLLQSTNGAMFRHSIHAQQKGPSSFARAEFVASIIDSLFCSPDAEAKELLNNITLKTVKPLASRDKSAKQTKIQTRVNIGKKLPFGITSSASALWTEIKAKVAANQREHIKRKIRTVGITTIYMKIFKKIGIGKIAARKSKANKQSMMNKYMLKYKPNKQGIEKRRRISKMKALGSRIKLFIKKFISLRSSRKITYFAANRATTTAPVLPFLFQEVQLKSIIQITTLEQYKKYCKPSSTEITQALMNMNLNETTD